MVLVAEGPPPLAMPAAVPAGREDTMRTPVGVDARRTGGDPTRAPSGGG
ncbi:hypothetical protein OG792_13295 [Micromonospora sp. NBC_01699]|nr:hypothetical protein [Micromonospora sp. NBC_01699]